MRALRHVLLVLGALLLLCAGAPAVAQPTAPAAAAPYPKEPVPCPTTDRVGAHTPPPAPFQRYYEDDWRLGPAQLPRSGPIAEMLKGWEGAPPSGSWGRLDHLSSTEFLGCYWDEDTSGWWFPDPDGWVLINGTPLHVTVTLQPGQKVDLFGSGFGHFLAPAGTPFAERALPPSSLNTLDPAFPFGYHLYEVVQPFTVEAGPIRPWFAQPGGGLQYLTTPSIPQLVAAGNLRPLN
ncbi:MULTISPECIES: TNT domain-containing protein [unclassified Streptomyces]|uniref:TNT domain-containing protein n=1 Tax=unclassified Streptomyces TaxID=2593676 RepID=UPI00336AC770